ncbi:MAG: HAMP domain-containing histidine kinase [Lachnospiraceae bacterium]|nr:HAMP domain-containing histidine kinase [Lachnospiraceae bacterium]
MRFSLRFKTTCILSFSLFLLIFICWYCNEKLLIVYYQNIKTDSLCDTYKEVNSFISSDEADDVDGFIHGIDLIETSNSANIYIISSYTLKYIYPVELNVNSNSLSLSDRFRRITNALRDYFIGPEMTKSGNQTERLETHDKFDISKFYDYDVNSYFIDLNGVLDNGDIVFIRTSFENIQESVSISSRFLAILGAVIIVLGSFIMFLFSSRFTKPINDLSEISDQMAMLNFEKKYEGKRSDEIGRLGKSINKLSEKLETTITELKSANIELMKDIKDKTEVDEMRKEFLSNVSHELKTPLAIIMGYAEGLKENIESDPEERDYYCDVIIDETKKMDGLVKKLLSLNEIEFGENKIDMTRFDIVELCRNVSSSMEMLTKDNDVRIEINKSEPIYVWADENLIEEVVVNYMSNAINHVNERKEIKIDFVESEKGVVRVSVFNSGDNIPESELENIWIKFYKVDKARTREYGGNGIGLSVVKAIMAQHKRDCGVLNRNGGVEFWFELDSKKE